MMAPLTGPSSSRQLQHAWRHRYARLLPPFELMVFLEFFRVMVEQRRPNLHIRIVAAPTTMACEPRPSFHGAFSSASISTD
jgi:hypothetical protein